ncbi:MAG: ABC transporter substrate-binding protein [Actinomycetota bacterium]|nr:ABC transporter substrate-binding protein [Actinomycetota bacterium]
MNAGVFEPLVSLGRDFTAQPGLAERWELVEPTRWRFHLRQGVRFHDGRPFTADDVVWSWTGREFLPTAVSNTLSTVTKVDDHTVDFVVSTPNLRLPEQLVHPEGPIVPRGGHNDSAPPIGTGPFRVVDYRPRQRAVLERFDGYWGEKPRVRRLTFLFLPEPEERIEALEDGTVDLVTNVPADLAARIEAHPSFRLIRAPLGATQSLSFNANALPELAVRQAVALALDRAAYVSLVLSGNGEPGRWMSPSGALGAPASLVDPVAFDPARARRLLDDAGWRPAADGVRVKDGRRLTLVLIGGPAVREAGLRFVQEQLKAIGVEVAVKRASDTVTFQEYRQAPYDADLGMSNQNDANPAFLAAGRSNEEQVAAALAAESREATQLIAAQMMRTIINEEFKVVPLAHVGRIYAMRHGVDLPNPHPSAISQSWVGLTTRP